MDIRLEVTSDTGPFGRDPRVSLVSKGNFTQKPTIRQDGRNVD